MTNDPITVSREIVREADELLMSYGDLMEGVEPDGHDAEFAGIERVVGALEAALKPQGPLPFYGGVEPVLEPSANGVSAYETVGSMYEGDWVEEDMERVFRAAIALRDRGVGTFGECLYTALIWERG